MEINEYTVIITDIAILKTQVAELYWWFKAIIGASILLVITQLWQLILIKRNGKRSKN